MSALIFQRLRRVSFGWLLGLSLALPLAQLALERHLVSHLSESARQTQREPASLPHGEHCPVCQMTAAIGAGGPPVAPVCWIAPDFGPMPVAPAAIATRPAPVALAYHSRAPPRTS